MDRMEKIKFLMSIEKGTIKPDSLKPHPDLLKMDLGDGNILYSIDRKRCTQAEYEAVCNPKVKIGYVTLKL